MPAPAQPPSPAAVPALGPGPTCDELIGPDPRDPFARPRPRAARRAAARAGQPGWLTGKAAAAYTCDAKIAPMVCGHLDRNALARLVTDWLAGDLANLVTSTDPVPAPGPRCACDEHPPAPRAAIPGALPTPPARQPAPPRPASPPAAPRPVAAPASPAPPTPAPRRHQRPRQRADPRRPGPPPGHPAPLRRQPALRPRRARRLPADPAHRRVLPRTQPPPRPRPAHRASPAAPAPRRDQARPALLLPRLHRTRPSAATSTTSSPGPKGGPTRLDNLTLLCMFHHLIAVHRWGWTLHLHADGTTTATSPEAAKPSTATAPRPAGTPSGPTRQHTAHPPPPPKSC